MLLLLFVLLFLVTIISRFYYFLLIYMYFLSIANISFQVELKQNKIISTLAHGCVPFMLQIHSLLLLLLLLVCFRELLRKKTFMMRLLLYTHVTAFTRNKTGHKVEYTLASHFLRTFICKYEYVSQYFSTLYVRIYVCILCTFDCEHPCVVRTHVNTKVFTD